MINNKDDRDDEVVVAIKGIASTGKGTGYVEEKEKRIPYFVSFTAPGDIVKVKEKSRQKKYVEAEIVGFVKKSDLRSDLTCPHYQICGGCNLLHLKYEEQLKAKAEIVKHVFERNGLGIFGIKVVSSPKTENYRFKAKFFLENVKGKVVCGFHKKGTHEIIAIEQCYIIHPKILEIIQLINSAQLGEKLRLVGLLVVDEEYEEEKTVLRLYSKKKTVSLENLLKGKVRIEYGDEEKLSYGYKISGKEYKLVYYPDSFVQTNLGVNQLMVKEIFESLSAGESLADFYCGNGNIGLSLVNMFKRVVFVENDSNSVKCLRENLQQNRLSAEVVWGEVDSFVQRNSEMKERFSAVIVDPPRSGCGEKVLDYFAKTKPKKIIYIACDLVSEIKEIKKLVSEGYKINKIVLLDMFPHIANMEVLVELGI